ncbi:NUDIX domain-containing protein [Streptomyces boluensis]|uniref:NUDIX domain-containing protein n=1 Tax=Streptomyces boluensis TaxID=1775135 RepID=A0A964UXR8_9ACTN|nr:NUDIX hydrolase [Streptomyces boluensis]NBE56263.1 NUDIX domain-containing protein [Streptomyces boluensis]
MEQQRGPWTRHSSTASWAGPRFQVHRDRITGPDGRPGDYDWVRAPDQVRVAAVVDGHLLVIEQYHYLTGTLWQLPGGAVDLADADPSAAARRELAEETGHHGGTWTGHGFLHPLPGLTDCKVHLWHVDRPSPGPATPEPSEADLRVRHVPLPEAAAAVREGLLRCAPSAALVLSLTS